MDIRVLTESSVDDLVKLHAVCFGPEAWSADQIKGSLSLPTTLAWGVLEAKKLCGFLLAQTVLDETEILTLAVHPSQQRRGIGEALVRTLQTRGGGLAVFLEVAEDNLPARRLYERCGFEVLGTRPDYYRRGSISVDAINYRFMVKT